MKLVVLDGHAVNAGDLSWDRFTKLGELSVYERTPAELIISRSREAEAIFTNKTPLDAHTIKQLPRLKFIGILATGYNVVDVAAARTLGIPVCNAAGYGTASVAQHAIALLLSLTNQIALHVQSVKAGVWTQCPDWTYRQSPLIELQGKTLGIVGLGAIGQQMAQLAQAFGMKVIAYNRSLRKVVGIQMVSLDTLFAESDVISLHCPLTPDTAKLVNEARLHRMKNAAFLLNTARGGLIDETALAEALQAERIAGAGLDVLSTEPPLPDNPLLTAPRCLITPHNAWGSREARQRLLDIAADNLRAFQAGDPQNVVNG